MLFLKARNSPPLVCVCVRMKIEVDIYMRTHVHVRVYVYDKFNQHIRTQKYTHKQVPMHHSSVAYPGPPPDAQPCLSLHLHHCENDNVNPQQILTISLEYVGVPHLFTYQGEGGHQHHLALGV